MTTEQKAELIAYFQTKLDIALRTGIKIQIHMAQYALDKAKA